MNGYEILDGAMLNSFIGEGTKFKGEFELDGLLRIDGDFSGIIKTKGRVLINGRAECDIYAGTVVIGGIVKGNITATEHVEILATGMVIGDIKAPSLIIEEGVLFCGSCSVYESGKLKNNLTDKENLNNNEKENKEKQNIEKTVNNDDIQIPDMNNENSVNPPIYENYLNNKNNNIDQDKNKSENNEKLYIENKY
jgi:cytoskeletal protein CcmA (bactofilin family)